MQQLQLRDHVSPHKHRLLLLLVQLVIAHLKDEVVPVLIPLLLFLQLLEDEFFRFFAHRFLFLCVLD